ncbi:DUF616 domain-containing protein [Microbacterium sp. NE2HP2]|uniref:glycosyltransferase domain-containing protein n=1 Tax=Microbacterium plantarum TaxID=1816425 RepID=UPI002367302D|nr:glycosyltransferase domain-containing protein [Microbacterium plantarum]MDD7945088.1 DUF616 domain-containing protein [Microbacterium plantarum]
MKLCVYTVSLGGYDRLLEQPVANASEADFICFTDDPDLTSETWEIVHVTPRFPQDLHRSSRVFKILGDERLAPYDVTICVDASVELRATPERIAADWLTPEVDLALAPHSFREKVIDEFDEVVRLKYDDPARVYEQLNDYALSYPEVLGAQPHWGGFLVRRNTPAVADAMRLWFDQVLRYSRRDQLSLMMPLTVTGLRWRAVDVDNFESEYHRWPVIGERKVALGKARSQPYGPMLAELRRNERRIRELEAEVARLSAEPVQELRETIDHFSRELAASTEVNRQLEARVMSVQREVWERDVMLREADSIAGSAKTLRRNVVRRIRSTLQRR